MIANRNKKNSAKNDAIFRYDVSVFQLNFGVL